jgi:hypothetical protein
MVRADSEARRRATLVHDLQDLGVRGVLVQMARMGQLLELRCEMPQCYCPTGRGPSSFELRSQPLRDWAPNPDHYPVLKSAGGHLTPDNVRLAHVLCNRRDYGWRMKIKSMLGDGISLNEIAEKLNRRNVPPPHGETEWSARTVRKAYVS